MVLPDGAADGAAVVLVAQRRIAGAGRGKRRGHRQRFVPVEVVSIPVNLVRAGLGRHVERTARAAAGLGIAGGLERVLVERVDRVNNAGNARNAALVHRIDLEVKIVVVGAVDGVVQLVAAQPIHRAGVVVAGKTRRGAEKLREVAAVQRRTLQRIAGKRGRLRDRGGIERKRVRGHLNADRLLRQSELHRQRVHLACQQLHIIHLRRGEAVRLDLDGIRAGREVVESKLARAR